ncbi:MAG TPA: hypothetical protein VIP11_00725 [Gemmatimonadaceae bacterium]|uniref:hypothetical protein n=1 Tax=Rhodococcus TaxID=1827 RepID=UPI001624F2A2|nr:hypothetical protein [Rhodococcus sp. KBW08]
MPNGKARTMTGRQSSKDNTFGYSADRPASKIGPITAKVKVKVVDRNGEAAKADAKN